MYAIDQWQDLEDALCVLSQDIHKVHQTLELRASTTRTFTAMLDTGADSNLVHPRVLPPGMDGPGKEFTEGTRCVASAHGHSRNYSTLYPTGPPEGQDVASYVSELAGRWYPTGAFY